MFARDDGSSFEAAVNEWLPRAHAVILGPGLGRDAFLQSRIQVFVLIPTKIYSFLWTFIEYSANFCTYSYFELT